MVGQSEREKEFLFSMTNFIDVAKICGDDPQTDLVKFGYKLNMEVNLKPFYICCGPT